MMPPEVVEYFANGKKRLVQINPLDNYSLLLEYEDEVKLIYDLKDKLTGIFTVLLDRDKFGQVFIDEDGNIAWDIDDGVDSNIEWSNRIDISADNAYIYGKKI